MRIYIKKHGEDLSICFVLYMGFTLRFHLDLGWLPAVIITPREQRSADACTVQTRFRLSHVCTCFAEMFFFIAPEPFF